MPAVRMTQWPGHARPAIGGGGRIPRKVLTYRALAVLGLLVLLGLTKHVVAAREVGSGTLSALPGGHQVTAGLDIGGMPSDFDLQALAESYEVDGVVNLVGPNVAEQVTTASLHQGYLRAPVPPGAAPTLGQLRALANFMRHETNHGGTVYIHDDVGGGRAVVTADMLLLLRGEPWAEVLQNTITEGGKSVSTRQMMALNQLVNALDGRARAGNLYTGARLDRW